LRRWEVIEFGKRNAEFGKRRGAKQLDFGVRNAEQCRTLGRCDGNGIRNREFGLRPIGAYAYAPAGKRKNKANSIAQGKGERRKDRSCEVEKMGG
jgi:hypothetical protein